MPPLLVRPLVIVPEPLRVPPETVTVLATSEPLTVVVPLVCVYAPPFIKEAISVAESARL